MYKKEENQAYLTHRCPRDTFTGFLSFRKIEITLSGKFPRNAFQRRSKEDTALKKITSKRTPLHISPLFLVMQSYTFKFFFRKVSLKIGIFFNVNSEKKIFFLLYTVIHFKVICCYQTIMLKLWNNLVKQKYLLFFKDILDLTTKIFRKVLIKIYKAKYFNIPPNILQRNWRACIDVMPHIYWINISKKFFRCKYWIIKSLLSQFGRYKRIHYQT